jgi:hypothetical protein
MQNITEKEMKTEQEDELCKCEAMSCVAPCNRNHTCHVFWCEKCQPDKFKDVYRKEEKNISQGNTATTDLISEPQTMEERIQVIATKIASTLDGKTVTSHEHYREMLAKEIKYHLASEIKTAQEEVVRDLIKIAISNDNYGDGTGGAYTDDMERYAESKGLNISDKKE